MMIPISDPNISLLTWKKLPDPSQLFFIFPQSLISDILKTSNHKWLDKPNEIKQETVNKNLDFFLPFREKLLLEPGIIILQLDPILTNTEMRLIYAFISRILGLINDRYGYFFDVIDRGMDYTKEAIPVSMTNAETGYHTDSTAKNYFPDIVGLLCLAAADEGGDSLVVNAANLYQYFWENHTDLVPCLYKPLSRDVITPGEINSQKAIQKNNFPLFSTDSQGLVFRYMRYWIEVAYSKLEIAQPQAITKTLDIIDNFFSERENIVRFKMKRGDVFYVNNRFLCHNRTAFKNSANPRQMVRSWINLSGIF